METQIIDGEKYVSEYVNVRSYKIPIVGKISQRMPNYIEFVSFRPMPQNSMNANFITLVEVNQFFEHFRFIYSFLDENGIQNIYILKSFLELCKNHISRNGRMIDNDLYEYVDKMIFVRMSLVFEIDNREITKGEINDMWSSFRKIAFDEFRNFIYITQYENKGSFNQNFKLIKLTEI